MRDDYLIDLQKIEADRRKKIWTYGVIAMTVLAIAQIFIYLSYRNNLANVQSENIQLRELLTELDTVHHLFTDRVNALTTINEELLKTQDSLNAYIEAQKLIIQDPTRTGGGGSVTKVKKPIIKDIRQKIDTIEKGEKVDVKIINPSKFKAYVNCLKKDHINVSETKKENLPFKLKPSKYGTVLCYSKTSDIKTVIILRDKLYACQKILADIEKVRSTGKGEPIILW